MKRASDGRGGAGRSLAVGLRLLADLGAILFAFAASYLVNLILIKSNLWVWHRPPDLFPYLFIAGVFSLVTLAVFWHLGLYQARASVLNLWELKTAVVGVAMSSAIFFALLFFLKLQGYSRAMVLASIGLAMIAIVVERRAMLGVLRRMQLRGSLSWRTLIYGCGETGQLVMKKIVQGAHLQSLVVGFLDDEAPIGSAISCRITQTSTELFGAPVLGGFADLPEIVRTWSVNEVLVTTPTNSPGRLGQILSACRACDVEVGVIPHLGTGRADQFEVEDLSAIPVMRAHRRPSRPLFLLAKRGLDVIGSVGLGLLTLPLWLLAPLFIKLDSPGPVFFMQERVGLRGARFRMYKFRTMRRGTSPYASSPVGDLDPRITRIGRWLRVGGIDELPQLWNVLKGEMSLVGPRPEMPFIVESYTDLERERLTVAPGITGLWQISADRHSEIHENIEYDLYYVKNQSFMLDLLILVETVLFTGGLLLGMLIRFGRPPSPAGASTGAPQQTRTQSAHSLNPRTGHILIALDQRRRDGRPPRSWVECLPVARGLAELWPIKVLIADDNRNAFQAIVKEHFQGVISPFAYVTYRGAEDVQSLIQRARLVVTDLDHVAEQARQREVDVLAIDEFGVPHDAWWRGFGLGKEPAMGDPSGAALGAVGQSVTTR